MARTDSQPRRERPARPIAAFDKRSFLRQFFPGEATLVEAGAAALVSTNHRQRLADLRGRIGLTQAQVAERMAVRQERVSAIERAARGATELRTLTAYIEALGGRLELTADFGAERLPLA